MKSSLLLKSLAVLLVFSFILLGKSYAQETKERGRDAWFLVGYGYTLPSDNAIEGIWGPASLTFGGDIWRFIGIEVSLSSKWKLGNTKYVNPVNNNTVVMKNALWTFDIKPYLLLQPKFGIDLISIRPYFGIGPTFSISGFTSTSDILGDSQSDTSFDVGFSTKLGVRLQALKFLFVGVGAEYMYHNPELSGVNKNLSGFSFGGEIGLIW